MKNSQSGFTLIELVIVIVILGILAAVAIPKFLDLSGDARQAATQGVAGALNSGSTINFSAALAKGLVQGAPLTNLTTIARGGVVDTSGGCTNTVAASLLQTGDATKFEAAPTAGAAPTPGSYSVTADTTKPTNVGEAVTCTLTNNEDLARSATFILLGAK